MDNLSDELKGKVFYDFYSILEYLRKRKVNESVIDNFIDWCNSEVSLFDINEVLDNEDDYNPDKVKIAETFKALGLPNSLWIYRI